MMKMQKPKKHRRLRVFADFQTQTAICFRTIIYWVVCQLSIFGTIWFLAGLDGPGGASGSVTRFLVPAMIVSTCLLPLALLDQLIFTNRFAGPLMNFRRKFSAFVNDGVAEEINFRRKDYYRDLQDNFNKLCKEIAPAEKVERVPVSTESEDETLVEA